MNLIGKLKVWFGTSWTTAKNTDRVFIQIGHILGGYAIVLTAYRFGLHLWISALLVEVWAIPKEFWFDYKYEDAATRGSSPLDFAMYQVGMVIAILLLR